MVMLRFILQSLQLNPTLNLFHMQTPIQLNKLMMMKWTISRNFYPKNMMMIFWMLDSRLFRIDYWLPLYLIFHTVYTVLFHKYVGANVEVKNSMSYFYMFVPTKATVKSANRNTGHAQVIGIVSCHFTNCPFIYPVGTVYYCPGHPSNTISLGDLKFYVGFQRLNLSF